MECGCGLDHDNMKRNLIGSHEFDKAQNKDKLQKHKVFHDARSLARVGIYINLRIQAIAFFYFVFLKEISSTLQGRAWFHSSNHITLFNHSESMGSL